MIFIKQPALAINSADIPEPKYTMWDTLYAPWNVRTALVVSQILFFARTRMSQGYPLLNVIINCHGNSGILSVGGQAFPAIDIGDVPAFAVLKPHLVHGPTMWLTGCKVGGGAKGMAFCSALAKACGCRVVAGGTTQFRKRPGDVFAVEATQRLNKAFGTFGRGAYSGVIDEFEGFVCQWDRNGRMSFCDPHRLLDAVWS
jgi:hypothetical protein